MYSAHDLEDFGKVASSRLLDKSVPLNKGIQKLAGENGLNRQQINRVVEAANIETYLSMMKTAESKYIKFDLADSNAIAEGLEMPKMSTANKIKANDYDISVIGMHADAIIEKVAEKSDTTEEPVERPQAELRKEAETLRGTVQLLQDAVYEAHASLDEEYLKLGHLVSQHVLSGEIFNEAAYVIKQAAHDEDNVIADSIKNDLSNSMPLVDFEAEFTPEGLLQTDTSLYKTASAVGDSLQRIQLTKLAMDDQIEKYMEAIDKTTKVVMISKYAGALSFAGKLVEIFKRSPRITTAVPVYGLAYTSGKKRGRREQGSALQEVYLKGQTRNPRKAFR